MYVCMYAYIYVCMYAYIYICVCVCIKKICCSSKERKKYFKMYRSMKRFIFFRISLGGPTHFKTSMYIRIYMSGYTYIYLYHHHDGMSLAWIFLTLSHYSSLSSITLNRSSMLYPVSVPNFYK